MKDLKGKKVENVSWKEMIRPATCVTLVDTEIVDGGSYEEQRE